jgi:hypothetical protein
MSTVIKQTNFLNNIEEGRQATCCCLPELLGVGDALLELALLGGALLCRGDLADVVDVVEHGGVGGELEAAVVPGSDDDGGDLGERAAHELLEPVPPGAGEEDDEPERDGGGAGSVPPRPAQVVLDVHQHGDGEQRAQADEEEEPVEEAHHLLLLAAVRLVELVRPEAGHARLEPARAQRRQVQGQVQHAQLRAARALARVLAGARSRAQPRRRRRDGQDRHALYVGAMQNQQVSNPSFFITIFPWVTTDLFLKKKSI